MDVALDQAGTGEAPPGIVDLGIRNLRIGRKRSPDCDNAAVLHGDVEEPVGLPACKARVADDEIHGDAH